METNSRTTQFQNVRSLQRRQLLFQKNVAFGLVERNKRNAGSIVSQNVLRRLHQWRDSCGSYWYYASLGAHNMCTICDDCSIDAGRFQRVDVKHTLNVTQYDAYWDILDHW